MTAGAQDASYVRRVQALDWPALYERHGFGAFLEGLRDAWKARYDFVLVDSRTGITDIGGICTVQLPDFLVILFTANDQSFLGALDVVRRAAEQRNKLPYDRAGLLTLPVASRFEMRVEYKMAQEWLRRFARELEPIFSAWAHAEVKPLDLLNYTRTPYVAYWSFGEKLPVVDEGTKDPESLGYALETVTAILAQRFAGSEVLVENRDDFVEGARSGAPAGDQKPLRRSSQGWQAAAALASVVAASTLGGALVGIPERRHSPRGRLFDEHGTAARRRFHGTLLGLASHHSLGRFLSARDIQVPAKKVDRIDAVLDAVPMEEALDELFSSDELKAICDDLGVPAGRSKAARIRYILGI